MADGSTSLQRHEEMSGSESAEPPSTLDGLIEGPTSVDLSKQTTLFRFAY